jgi:hypothetical protein
MIAVALERATRRQPSTRSEATMCWGKLPRHSGRAFARPLCGPWPRPHLAATKLVELRSSVDLVAMPQQPLDRHTPEPINPALRRVATQRSWNWAVLVGSPRCGCRGERQNAGDTNPGVLSPTSGRLGGRLGGTGLSEPSRRGLYLRRSSASAASVKLLSILPHAASHWLRSQGSLSQKWREKASAWGSSPSRLCVSGRSLSHANDQDSQPLPDPAAARRCGGRSPVIRC